MAKKVAATSLAILFLFMGATIGWLAYAQVNGDQPDFSKERRLGEEFRREMERRWQQDAIRRLDEKIDCLEWYREMGKSPPLGAC